MDKYPCYLVCVVCLITRAFAYCPDPDDLPMEMNSRTYLCARMYSYRGCAGNSFNIGNRHSSSEPERMWDSDGNYWDDVTSSIVVRPHCTLTVWDYPLSEGRKSVGNTYIPTRDGRKLYGGLDLKITGKYEANLANNRRTWWGASWDNVISGYHCWCDYNNDPLRCTPTEEYEDIKICHNPSPGSMTCSQTTQRGMSVGESVTEGKSISVSLTASLGFEKVFSAGLGLSRTTTHNWSRSNSKNYQTLSSETVICDVPVGHTVTMRQVVGRCGDTVVRTSTYRCEGGSLR